MTKGIGRRLSPTRPSPAAGGARVSSGPSMLGNHVVGSRASQAPPRAAYTLTAHYPPHTSPTSGSNPWGQGFLNTQHVTPAMVSEQIGLSARAPEPTPAHAPTFQAVAASTATTGFGSSAPPQPQGFGNASIGINASAGDPSRSTPSTVVPMAPPPVPTFSTPNNQVNGLQPAATTSTRQLIVTNWGPNPVGPVIPAHLRQTSAAACIAEISQMTGIRGLRNGTSWNSS